MKIVRLGEVTTIERRIVYPDELAGHTAYLGLEHIASGGRLLGAETVASASVTSTKFSFSADHVLFGKLRPNLAKVVKPSFSGVCSTDILPILPGEMLDRSYLTYFLLSPGVVSLATTRASGANLPRLSPSQLASFEIPLPSLEEQRRIAAILDKADEARTKRRKLLTALEALPQAVFDGLLGRVGSLPTVSLGSVTSLSAGRSLVASDTSADHAYRVLKISSVTTGRFQPTESKPLPPDYVPPPEHLVREGDLLMSRANTAELVGAVAHVASTPGNLALSDKIWRFDWLVPAEPLFFQALLASSLIRRQISRLASGTGGSMKNVSKVKLLAMRVPLPPLSAQQEFARKVAAIDTQRRLVEAALEKDDELFASLQSRAFSGRL